MQTLHLSRLSFFRRVLVLCLVAWLDVFERADIVRMGNHTELVLSIATVAAVTLRLMSCSARQF